MSAIQPNKNFDNERQEHTPYGEKKPVDMKAVYERFKQEKESERYRSRNVRNPEAYSKWFKTE
jgi:hypothetical protein